MSVGRRLHQTSTGKGPLMASLHVPTPLLYSTSMSKQAGCNVWLKLENLQPTQSFKIRGVGNFCTKAVLERGATRLVTVGDTNAALAVAYSGRQLGVPVTIFVPSGMQASVARAKIELEGAEIIEKGRTVKDASDAAHVFVHETAGAIVVGAADDTAVIAGNATIATEINVQLQQKEPAVIITVVGSGGHLAGLLSGLQRCHWQSVPVIAVETHNTNSFQQALLADTKLPGSTSTAGSSNGGKKKSKPGSLPNEELHIPTLFPPLDAETAGGIDSKSSASNKYSSRSDGDSMLQYHSRGRSGNDRSLEPTVATCLLSGSICPSALELSKTHPVVPVSVSEAMAAEACRRLLDDHQLLVEIGSAAALSIVGKGLVHQIVPDLDCNSHVVVIVTGGANISFDRLEACRQRFPYPAPIIAKSGHEIFMRMPDPASSSAASGALSVSSAGVAATHTRNTTPGDTNVMSSQPKSSAASTPLQVSAPAQL